MVVKGYVFPLVVILHIPGAVRPQRAVPFKHVCVHQQPEADIQQILGIKAKITLVEPKSIPRSEGKAVRVIDKRKLV